MVRSYGTNPIYLKILAEIDRKYERLTTYLRFSKCPSTTNLIEGYNRHLADRIKSISGFKRYDTAALWLNSYVIWRRTCNLSVDSYHPDRKKRSQVRKLLSFNYQHSQNDSNCILQKLYKKRKEQSRSKKTIKKVDLFSTNEYLGGLTIVDYLTKDD